ncbi:diacylglycerol kinase family protein [Streptomyces sp. NRRL B-24484]|uniref:diacylglycerol kinase family protein n=1 Tax=Streptomyces sp. NRRL B-24484 TaxID=1463833 RepID=UPI001331454B|nr:diacylglycerol kinase family protein [Streptomyces sp. NRRL B-24484]
MTTHVGGRLARRVVGPLVVQAGLLVLLGLLIVHPPFGLWDARESAVDGWLAAHRGAAATACSAWLSAAAFTPAVVAVTALAVLALLVAGRPARWREAVFLAGAVAAQAVLFVLAAALVGRDRPDVLRLDGALPTSSYPSGHVGAATALYGGLGVLALLLGRGRWRFVLCAALWLLPPLVAASRLYRGMHHPSDVVAGLLNGAAALWVMHRAVLDRPSPVRAPAPGRPLRPVDRPADRAVVLVNPVVATAGAVAEVRAVLAAHGIAVSATAETGAEDAGRSAAERAVADGATLLVACGGDGTVTACAAALAGTDADLAVVPCGTGNLLARNLGLPSAPGPALAAALDGVPRRLDLAEASGDGMAPAVVVAMAGMGLDAAVMAGTGRRLKQRLGWPAYAIGAARHLGDRPVRLTVRLDGAEPFERRVRMAVIGNVGALQGGMRLLPDAEPDDGVLDLVLLHPRGPAGWLAVLAALLTGRGRGRTDRGPDGPFEHFRARSIELLADRACPRELDGDPVPEGRSLRLAVRPGAITVRAPAPRPAPAGPEVGTEPGTEVGPEGAAA